MELAITAAEKFVKADAFAPWPAVDETSTSTELGIFKPGERR
jgi:hypothetical protein